MKKRMIVSIDVDHFPGSEVGVQRILDLLDEKGLSAAFFITGRFGEEYPENVNEIFKKGHEIGCHGYSHGLDMEENFISLSYDEQVERIAKSSGILERTIGEKVTMFRAPFAKADGDTVRALEAQGYRIDSSVTSRRFDFGMGVSNSIGAFFAPTRPYHPSLDNIHKRGDSQVLEVPISAFFAPLTLSAIRTFGPGKVQRLLQWSLRFFDPLVFYMHPWEVMGVNEIVLWDGIPKRHLKNRGETALRAFDSFVDSITGYVDFALFGDILARIAEEEER
jgi:peptidoglycan/xylan/chitin deacetylase (PgdA/CDA1 family)